MGFLTVDGTLVVQLVNFAIFFAILNVVFLRPVGKAIAKRREYIKSLVLDYDRYQEEARALRAEADNVRLAARRDAEHAVGAARAAGSNQAAEVSSQYAQRAAAIVEEAQRRAHAELEAARAGENETVAQLAALMVERIVPEAAR